MNIANRFLTFSLLALLMFACVPAPRPRTVVIEPVPEPALDTEVYFAPMRGQSSQQQDRDRYECYLWAKGQTGFDPSYPNLAPHQRTIVVPDPAPGSDTAVGAITGAVIGAVIGSPHHAGEGAIIGALAGGTLGAASDADRQQQAANIEAEYAQQAQRRQSTLDRQAESYRRAMKACLEGRGYSVH